MRHRFLGVTMQSPVVIGSGPLCYGAQGLIRLHRAGAGAVTTKTINLEAAKNPVPHIAAAGGNSLLNCEKWSDYAPEQWVEREIPEAKAAGVTVIASVGASVQERPELVKELVRAGVDIVELVSYKEADLPPMVGAFRKLCDVPMLAKLSANFSDFSGTACACRTLGCDGFTACDSVGPALRVDIETGLPLMSGGSQGWLSGVAIKPLILERVLRLRQEFDCPILGLGGVTTWEDCIEFAMAGAGALGICSVPMLQGVEVIGRLIRGMDAYLERHGYASLDELSGLTARLLQAPVPAFHMEYDKTRCTSCRRCVTVCPYQARALDGDKNMTVDLTLCRSCGLCISVCPRGCLE